MVWYIATYREYERIDFEIVHFFTPDCRPILIYYTPYTRDDIDYDEQTRGKKLDVRAPATNINSNMVILIETSSSAVLRRIQIACSMTDNLSLFSYDICTTAKEYNYKFLILTNSI